MTSFLYNAWLWTSEYGAPIGTVSFMPLIYEFAKYILKNYIKDTCWLNKKKSVLKKTFLIACAGISAFSFICVPVHMKYTQVPDMTNITYDGARILAELNDLKIKLGENQILNWYDRVLYHTPTADEIVPKNSCVTIYMHGENHYSKFGSDELEPLAEVPNVIGMEQTEAADCLQSKDLSFQVWWSTENNIPATTYYVVNQSIAGDEKTLIHSVVELEISPYKPE